MKNFQIKLIIFITLLAILLVLRIFLEVEDDVPLVCKIFLKVEEDQDVHVDDYNDKYIYESSTPKDNQSQYHVTVANPSINAQIGREMLGINERFSHHWTINGNNTVNELVGVLFFTFGGT